jgi:hypothetical protein
MTEKWQHLTPKNAQRAIVSWRDIREIGAWDDDTEEIRPARRLETIGWLLYEGPDPFEPDSDVLVLAKTYDWEEQRWADYTAFPKVVLKRLDRLP